MQHQFTEDQVRRVGRAGASEQEGLTIEIQRTAIRRAGALIGEDGEVVASWSGLTADESYLGAISHTGDGDELLGLTLVEIET